MAQTSKHSVSVIVTTAWKMRSFEIEQAAPSRVHLVDRGIEAFALTGKAEECPHQRHIADDVHHFAVDRCGLAGKVVMQQLPGGGEAWNISTTMMSATIARLPPIVRLMVQTSAIAATVAHGGSTFHMNMFSAVKTALDVAVTFKVSMPGMRSENKLANALSGGGTDRAADRR